MAQINLKLIFVWLFALIFVGLSNQGHAQSLRADGGGTYRQFRDHNRNAGRPYEFSKIRGPQEFIREGRRAFRFELRAGNCGAEDCRSDRERVERVEKDGARPGREQWHAWSMMLDASFTHAPRISTLLGQFKQEPHGNQLFSFSVENNYLVMSLVRASDAEIARDVDTANVQFNIDRRLMPLGQARGRWLDIMVHSNWSPNPDGFFEVFVNGERVGSYRGQITYNTRDDVTFRFGIYRSHLSRYSGTQPTNVAYFDNIRRGNTRASVELPRR